jgi:hypothetical protein
VPDTACNCVVPLVIVPPDTEIAPAKDGFAATLPKASNATAANQRQKTCRAIFEPPFFEMDSSEPTPEGPQNEVAIPVPNLLRSQIRRKTG